jgi:hypothetical protein
MALPPRTLRLCEVPTYLINRWGINISRQTVNNWVLTGRKDPRHGERVFLKVQGELGNRRTTSHWVDNFICQIMPWKGDLQ